MKKKNLDDLYIDNENRGQFFIALDWKELKMLGNVVWAMWLTYN